MGASKFPNDQNSKLVDENGLPISATNPLEVDIKNTTVPVSGTVTANVAFPSSQTVNISSTGNAIKIDQTTVGANGVEIVNTPIVKVENEILPGGAKKSLTVDGSVIVTNVTAGGVTQPLLVGGNVGITGTPSVNVSSVPTTNVKTTGTDTVVVSIGQSTTQNHVELVDAIGNPIGLTANPLVVAPSTSVPIVNTVGDVLDVEIKSGANTASVDANGRLAVDINANGLSPSVTASLTSITTSDKLNVKTTGTDTVAVTGSVNIDTMPPITVSDVGIKTTANTVKIDSNNNTVQLNTGYQDPNQKPIVNIKNPANSLGGTIPLDVQGTVTLNGVSSVNFTNTSINANITNDQLEVKNDIGNPLSVYFPTEPSVTINSTNAVKVDGSAVTQPISGTVKIDQATAGANNIRIVDKTNTSHVATVGNNGSVHTVITNDTASAVPTTITGTPNVNATIVGTPSVTGQMTILGGNVGINTAANTVKLDSTANTVQVSGTPNVAVTSMPTTTVTGNVGITGNPTVNINQATAGANHVEIVNAGGLANSAAEPLFTSTVLRDGANQAVIDGNGVLSVKFPSTPNVSVANIPSVRVDQTVAGANHVEIVDAGGLANSAVNPLFTSTAITNTPNVNITNASVNVSASSNLPVQGTVAISTINGIAPAIDASGNLQIEIAGTGNTVGLSTSANEVKINQTTPDANHVEIVNSTGAVNGAANPLFTSTVVSNDVTTLNKAVWAVGDFTSLSKTHFSNYYSAVANSSTTAIVSGIAGYRLRLDKIFIHAETNLSSCVHTDTFTLRSQGSSVRDIHVFRGVSTVTTGFVYDFIPPDGGLLLEDGANLSIFNNNMSAGTPGFNMQVTLFYQFV